MFGKSTAAAKLSQQNRMEDVRRVSERQPFVRRFAKNRVGVVSVVGILFLVIVATLGPALYPVDPNAQDLLERNAAPSPDHLLGTDDLGRDLLSRMISGTGITLLAPAIAVAIGMALGVPTGLVAGYFEGGFDWIVSRLADALFAIPTILLAMTIVAIRGPSTLVVMMGVGLLMAPRIFRVVRADTISVKTKPYFEAAVTVGVSPFRIIAKHLVPNISSSLIVQGTVLLGLGVLVEAALSFFGMGVQPPGSSWGVLLRRSFDNLSSAPFQSIPPGIAITCLVLAFQTIGDALRNSIGRDRSQSA